MVPLSRIEGLPGLSCLPGFPAIQLAFLPLTCQVAEALVVAVSIWVALLDGQAPVAERGGKDGGPMLHQSNADGSVVARSCAVQGGPGRKEAASSGKACIVSGQRAHRVLRSPQAGGHHPSCSPSRPWDSPAVAVWRIDVGPNVDQEVHDAVVGPTDGIVQGGDALVIRLARVIQLWQERGREPSKAEQAGLQNGHSNSWDRFTQKPSLVVPPSHQFI